MDDGLGYSSALLAAQQRLTNLREQQRLGPLLPAVPTRGRLPQPIGDLLPAAANQPSHSSGPPPAAEERQLAAHVKVYPDLAFGLLRANAAAAGRIWLLLHHLDEAGRGWLAEADVRERLTGRDSAWRVCGQRQLRNLLRRGDGLFWQRLGGRLWLRSTAKVAAALGVPRVSGRPVALPLSHLLGGIGQVRAHLYASFLSNRSDRATGRTPAPIARATLARLSHVSRRSQRNYEFRAGIRQQTNFALGRSSNPQTNQQCAWQYGRASFRFTDHAGRQGRRGAIYNAWQLPNSYTGPHRRLPQGCQKRLNRKLADLFMKGMTGNDKSGAAIDMRGSRRFFQSGARAAAHYGRHPRQDLYWLAGRGRARIWLVLPAQTGDD